MPLSSIPERHAVDAEFRVVSDILLLIDTIQRRSRGSRTQIIPFGRGIDGWPGTGVAAQIGGSRVKNSETHVT
jgi:hypothetical protein